MVANTGQTAPDDEWLSQVIEEIIEPDLAIIDPHHHLWLRNGYTYLMPELASDLAAGTTSSQPSTQNATPCIERRGQ